MRTRESLTHERTAVYRHYDRIGGLLYVGITRVPDIRTVQHKAGPFGREITRTEIEWYDNRTMARWVERSAIASERPEYNVQDDVTYGELRVFLGWLRGRRDEDTPIGDLARDVSADTCMPQIGTFNTIFEHITEHHNASMCVERALSAAWDAWRGSPIADELRWRFENYEVRW